ncbi:hypothetical protein JMN32_02375 [Fulvivirga sp. 29W222]|uniref:Uncharacterized protein n=1 Tax=Fulvivirga marina TaxID=2494733 RepID=A0A937FY96_9BACT|nr:hypothetical protein [Fulvivirga marina]MBL6445136.1 hypothetical protein [Fulvivirga marina]
MHYRSPFPILDYTGIDLKEINDQTLTKAKKILLVEIDHADNGSITIDGETLTKNDILLLFESLSNTEYLIYHRWINENPGLRALLENKTLDDYEEIFDEQLLSHDKASGFKAFVSPYLAQPLGKILSQTFTRQEYTRGLKIIKATQLIEHANYDVTFGKLQSNIRGITAELKLFNERGVGQFKEHQCHYINYYFIQFLNQLPDGFGVLRDNFATELINLTVTIQHNHSHLCKRLYFSLSALNCSDEIKEVIKNNLKIFQRVTGDSSSAGKKETESQGSGAIIFKVGFMAIFFLIFILKNCDNTSSRRVDYKMELTQPMTHRLTHLKNMLDLKMLCKQQIKQGYLMAEENNSINIADSTLWPYTSEYQNLISYTPEIGQKISVTNESHYDVVVFLSTNWHNYSAFLNPGEKLSFNMASKDYLQFYPGQHWKHDLRSKLETTQRQHFAKVDSTTLTFLDKIWQRQCSHTTPCRDSSFSLYIDKGNSLKFSGNNHTSGFKEVNEYFYLKTLSGNHTE